MKKPLPCLIEKFVRDIEMWKEWQYRLDWGQ